MDKISKKLLNSEKALKNAKKCEKCSRKEKN